MSNNDTTATATIDKTIIPTTQDIINMNDEELLAQWEQVKADYERIHCSSSN